ncbi:hypothetical protein [Flagellimonas onchidii]|uniref:hypothetical protein n=1 Tax=Flagellimonas onchidii TaxID=2562684 RepID=UPI0010A618F6|nr:hypothetical protein [Allomuricauda onchidii]
MVNINNVGSNQNTGIKEMKKNMLLILGGFVGILILFLAIYSQWCKNNRETTISEGEGSISSENKKIFAQNDTVNLNAEYFKIYGDNASGDSFAIEFYEPEPTGDFYAHMIQLKGSLYVKTIPKIVYDIANSRHHTPIADLIPINIDSLSKKPIYLRNKFSNDEETYIVLEVVQNKLARMTYEFGIQNTGICIPVHFNGKPTMMFFIFNNMNGYLMKTRDGWEGKIGATTFTSEYFEETTIFLPRDMTAFQNLKLLERSFYYEAGDFVIEKGQVYSRRILNKPLLKTTMDTLYSVGKTHYKNLIVGEKNNKKYLFNGLLQDITPPDGFRAIGNGEIFSVLANDNKVYSINDIGTLSKMDNLEKMKEGDTDEYHNYQYEIKERNETSFYITCKGGYGTNSLLETYRTTPISKLGLAQEVTFVNNKKRIRVSTRNIYEIHNYLVAEVNGFYGLYEFDNIVNYNFEEGMEEVVVNTELTSLLPNKYTQMYAHEMTQLVFFEKKGLKGYFPLHARGRYKELSPFINNAFARFTLPDGKKGWLQHNGKEYFD